MKFPHIFKATAALVMATGLAGCFDVDMEVKILDDDTAVARIESTVSSQLISLADIESGDAEFCDEGGEIITNDADETITCIEVHEGKFDEVLPQSSGDDPQPTIETVAPGRVKVTFPTGSLGEELGGGSDNEEMDEQMKEMMTQMFAGHALTMRVAGPKIAETNMVLSADGKSAELSVPFTDLIENKLDLPDDAYAIVALD